MDELGDESPTRRFACLRVVRRADMLLDRERCICGLVFAGGTDSSAAEEKGCVAMHRTVQYQMWTMYFCTYCTVGP